MNTFSHFVSSFAKRLARNERGTSALEFGIVFPIMIFLTLGSVGRPSLRPPS